MLLYKPWRRRIDQRRLRCATFEPLPTEAEADVGDRQAKDEERVDHQSKAAHISVEPIETTDAAVLAGPSESRI